MWFIHVFIYIYTFISYIYRCYKLIIVAYFMKLIDSLFLSSEFIYNATITCLQREWYVSSAPFLVVTDYPFFYSIILLFSFYSSFNFYFYFHIYIHFYLYFYSIFIFIFIYFLFIQYLFNFYFYFHFYIHFYFYFWRFIFKSLGIRCVPFLDQIVPYLLQVARKCGPGLRESLLQQLALLTSIVHHNISPFLPALFDIIRDYWSEHQEHILILGNQINSFFIIFYMVLHYFIYFFYSIL